MFIIKSLLKKILIFVIIILFLTAFSNSYNALSIDKLAYVVAVGIDKSSKDRYSFSFQFTNVTSNTQSGTAEKSPSIVNSVEASSLSNAINLINTYIDKRINLSHCKVFVFSEEIAKDGISDHVYTLMNNSQVRPSAYIVVSKCNAKYYIENSKPILDNLITKYYDIFPTSSDYTAYTYNATIGEFFNKLECETSCPTAILGGMNTSDISANNDSANKSNESTISGKRGSENIGLAVFKDDKMVGELNAIECLSYINMINNAKGFFISVPDPENKTKHLDLYLSPTNVPKIDVNILNGSPYIRIKLRYTARIYSIDSDAKYLSPHVLSSIANSCNNYLESTFLNYLYKTSKEFKADINCFGKYALSKFGTSKDFTNYNWNYNYKDSVFDVNIDTDVESSILITET